MGGIKFFNWSIRRVESDYIRIFILFLLWRLYLFAAYFLSDSFLPFVRSFPYIDETLRSSGLPIFIQSFANFDGVHYLTIAKYGYTGLVGFEQVFFPLFPTLLYFVEHITGYTLLIGILFTNISFLFSMFLLFNIVKHRYGSQVAWMSLFFLVSFPTSFYFGSLYTESLFLLLTLLSFYFFEKKMFVSSGLMAMLMSATRLAGILTVPAFLYEIIKKRMLSIKSVFALLFPFLGIGLYMVYLYIFFHSPLAFMEAQSAFKNERATNISSLVFLPQVVYRYLRIFTTVSWTSYSFWIALLEIGSFLTIFLLILISIRKKIFLAYIVIFSLLSLILPTLSGTFSSIPRYILPIYPIYIVLALIPSNKVKFSIIIFFIILLGILVSLFTHGYWVS